MADTPVVDPKDIVIEQLQAHIEALEKALRECLDHLDVENMTTQEVEHRARTALCSKEKR